MRSPRSYLRPWQLTCVLLALFCATKVFLTMISNSYGLLDIVGVLLGRFIVSGGLGRNHPSLSSKHGQPLVVSIDTVVSPCSMPDISPWPGGFHIIWRFATFGVFVKDRNNSRSGSSFLCPCHALAALLTCRWYPPCRKHTPLCKSASWGVAPAA